MKLSLINKKIKQKWVKSDNLKIGDVVRFVKDNGKYRYCKITDKNIDFIHGRFHDNLGDINKNGIYGGIYISTVTEVLR